MVIRMKRGIKIRVRMKGPKIILPMAKKIIFQWLNNGPYKILVSSYGHYHVIMSDGHVIGIIRVVIVDTSNIQGYVCLPFSYIRVYFHIVIER